MDWNRIVADCYKTIGEAKDVATLHCIPAVFQNIVVAALVFAGVIALFVIVYAGLKLVLSGGDAKQVEGARSTLTYAIVGLVIILLSFFIISFIAYVTGTSDFILKFGFQN